MKETKTLLAFGDSNTWGLVPGSSPARRFPRDIRWTGILQSVLSDVDVIEEGLCGRTTIFEDRLRAGRNGLSSLPFILESKSPIDAAVIMLGTNDCKPIYSASAHVIGSGLQKCLDILQEYVRAEKILVVSPLFLGDDVWLPSKDPEFSPASVKVSRELKDVYGDISAKRGHRFLAASDFVTPSSTDDEHMDEAGHSAFAKAVIDKLRSSGII